MSHRETDAVHAGERHEGRRGAIAEPIVLSSTFEHPELMDGSPAPYIYTRHANPTIEATERRIAALEGAGSAVLFASGMAAIAGALSTLLQTGDTLVSTPRLYGGTGELFKHGLPRNGITPRLLDGAVLTRPERLTDAVQPTDRVLYIESPTNPMLRVLDVPALIEVAHDAGLRVVVDNTFAGPTIARPAEWGADLVCESATKMLGGHSDLIAGVVAGDGELVEQVRQHRGVWGSCIDPAAAYRLLRGIPTLPLRTRRSGETALRLAERLEAAPWCEAVHHPHLPHHPDHDTALRTLDGPLPMLTIVVTDKEAGAKRLRRGVRLFRPAPSLGGVESLLSLPAETSHVHMSEEERLAAGIPPGTVRLPIGLEHVDDLFADLERAMTGP